MKVAVLFSGGKDSCLALHKAKLAGHEILYLLNINVSNKDSFTFHKPDLKLLERQAVELGIDLVVKESKGEKDKELEDLKELVVGVKDEIEGIVVGGIASSYQCKRIKKICDEFGLEFIVPLWDYSPEKIWEELLDKGFEVVLTKISCEGLGKEWLGKKIGAEEFGKLKEIADRYKFRLDFEGGEAETGVLFMPRFDKRIEIEFDIKSEGEHRHWIEIKKVY